MKSIHFAAILAVFSLVFTACQPKNKTAPAPSPAPPPVAEQAQNGGADLEDSDILAIEISGGSAIVPDPRRVSTLIEMRKEGDLLPVFIVQKATGGGQKDSEKSFSLTGESASKAIDWMQKIGAISQKEFSADGPPMVGSGPKFFSFRKNGTEAARFTVNLGAKADPALVALEKLAADEIADYDEMKSGMVGKIEAFLEGKVWQSDANPKQRISFRNGRFVTFNEKGEEPGAVFVSLRRHCPDGCGRMSKKSLAEGMKAGFICCATLTAQDDVCFLILEAEGNKLELIGTEDNAKSETFTHLKRG